MVLTYGLDLWFLTDVDPKTHSLGWNGKIRLAYSSWDNF